MKKNKAIVLGLTTNHVFAAASVLMDLKKYSPLIADEIVIFTDKDLNKKDKKILCKFFPIKFLIYDFPIKNTEIFNQSTLRYFSKMVFSKYECLRLLDDYKTVMWLDYDIIVTKDISELMNESNFGIKMMPSPGCTVNAQLHEPISDYDMNAQAICASTFVLNDNLKNYRDLYDFCYNKLIKYAKYLLNGEQAIFDFMIQEFQLEYEKIDYLVYSPHPTEFEKFDNAKILHAFGQPKFWNGLKNTQWQENYNNWVKMGGTKNENSLFLKKIKNLRIYIVNIFKSIK